MVIGTLVKNKHLNVPNAYYYQKMTEFILALTDLILFRLNEVFLSANY